MKYNEFAKEVHQNAVEHGWWDEDRSAGEIIALCHSEISEALEEYRANRPNAYVVHPNRDAAGHIDYYAIIKYETDVSKWCKKDKPEGIAVELADVIIRCFDYFGKAGLDVGELFEDAVQIIPKRIGVINLTVFGNFISLLHLLLSMAFDINVSGHGIRYSLLCMAACCHEIFAWAEREGVDMHELMRIKHEYNKGRPYKHGKVM